MKAAPRGTGGRSLALYGLCALGPALLLLVAATPVDLLGCRLRGLLAFGIALASALAALGLAVEAVRRQTRREPGGERLVLAALILALAPLALLVLA